MDLRVSRPNPGLFGPPVEQGQSLATAASRVIFPFGAGLIGRAILFGVGGWQGRPHAAPEDDDDDVALGRLGKLAIDRFLRGEMGVEAGGRMGIVPADHIERRPPPNERAVRQHVLDQLPRNIALRLNIPRRGQENPELLDTFRQ